MKPFVKLTACLIISLVGQSCKDHTTTPPTSTSCDVVSTLSQLRVGSYWIFSHVPSPKSDSDKTILNPTEDSLVIVRIDAAKGKDGVPAYVLCEFFWDDIGKTRIVDTLYWAIKDNCLWANNWNQRLPCSCDASLQLKWRLLYACDGQARTVASQSMPGDSLHVMQFDSLTHTNKAISAATELQLYNTFSNDGLLYVNTPNLTHVMAEQYSSTESWNYVISSSAPDVRFASNGRRNINSYDARTMRFTPTDGIIQYESRTTTLDGHSIIGTTVSGATFALSYQRHLLRYLFVK